MRSHVTTRSDVNIRSVYAAQTIGGLQRSGLQTFCNIMDLPPPIAKINFNNVSKIIAKSAKDAAKCILKEAGERLLAVTVEKYPENIEVDGQGEMIGNVDVLVDGTWQRRGHTSKIGVVLSYL